MKITKPLISAQIICILILSYIFANNLVEPGDFYNKTIGVFVTCNFSPSLVILNTAFYFFLIITPSIITAFEITNWLNAKYKTISLHSEMFIIAYSLSLIELLMLSLLIWTPLIMVLPPVIIILMVISLLRDTSKHLWLKKTIFTLGLIEMLCSLIFISLNC